MSSNATSSLRSHISSRPSQSTVPERAMRGCTEDLSECNTMLRNFPWLPWPNKGEGRICIRKFRRPGVLYSNIVCYENLSAEGGVSAWRRFWHLMMVTHRIQMTIRNPQATTIRSLNLSATQQQRVVHEYGQIST